MLSYSELVRLATALGGLPILGCLAGSPAEGAGVRYGDILLTVNGIQTASWDDFVRARSTSSGGDGGYVLPVKAVVRTHERISDGDAVTLAMSVAPRRGRAANDAT